MTPHQKRIVRASERARERVRRFTNDSPRPVSRQRTVTREDRVLLVSCVKQKLSAPTIARYLYQSRWFRKARRFAESTAAPWFILSARHGLTDPDTWLEPYEQSLHDATPAERSRWATKIAGELRARFDPDHTAIEIYAGAVYRRELVPLLRYYGFTVTTPLQGLGIGEQMATLEGETP